MEERLKLVEQIKCNHCKRRLEDYMATGGKPSINFLTEYIITQKYKYREEVFCANHLMTKLKFDGELVQVDRSFITYEDAVGNLIGDEDDLTEEIISNLIGNTKHDIEEMEE